MTKKSDSRILYSSAVNRTFLNWTSWASHLVGDDIYLNGIMSYHHQPISSVTDIPDEPQNFRHTDTQSSSYPSFPQCLSLCRVPTLPYQNILFMLDHVLSKGLLLRPTLVALCIQNALWLEPEWPINDSRTFTKRGTYTWTIVASLKGHLH